MIRWNASKSNEAIDREQAIANLRKLTRYCKWAQSAPPWRSLWDSSQSLQSTIYSYCLASPKGSVSNP